MCKTEQGRYHHLFDTKEGSQDVFSAHFVKSFYLYPESTKTLHLIRKGIREGSLEFMYFRYKMLLGRSESLMLLH